MNLQNKVLVALQATLVLFLAVQAASATTFYTDVIGTSVSFTGIQESSSFGDPEPLFDQPVGLGDALLFFPPNFVATSSGGGIDQTGSQLQLMISTNSSFVAIDSLEINEFGDALFTDPGAVGTAATGTFVSMAGFLTVVETASGPIAPVIIPFSGTITPSDTLSLPGDIGTTLWSGSVVVDVASVVPNATKAFLSFDNDLTASSEVGTTAKIQKKALSGPVGVIGVVPGPMVPEPSSLLLAGLGLLGMAGYCWRRRRA